MRMNRVKAAALGGGFLIVTPPGRHRTTGAGSGGAPGPSRPELQQIATNAFKLFGATMDLYPNPTPPASDMSSFFRFLPGIDTSEFHNYFHTDLETPQTVPWTGLEASTHAYARIIDEVNKLPLSTFQRPEEPTPTVR